MLALSAGLGSDPPGKLGDVAVGSDLAGRLSDFAVGSDPAAGLGEVAVGGGALGSVSVGNGAGEALGLSRPSNADCRCDAASARNWAKGGGALRVESMGRDIACKQMNVRFCSDSTDVNRVRRIDFQANEAK